MDHPEYRMAYAKYYPLYVMRWETRARHECVYARHDIVATLHACGENDPAYVGKLYAELDAVRDRVLVLDQRLKA